MLVVSVLFRSPAANDRVVLVEKVECSYRSNIEATIKLRKFCDNLKWGRADKFHNPNKESKNSNRINF